MPLLLILNSYRSYLSKVICIALPGQVLLNSHFQKLMLITSLKRLPRICSSSLSLLLRKHSMKATYHKYESFSSYFQVSAITSEQGSKHCSDVILMSFNR